jgi:hypothetical protein
MKQYVAAGYLAYNGHVFSADDAFTYNLACEYADKFPTEWNLNYRHKIFCIIIGVYK